jgi:hypothetical protein
MKSQLYAASAMSYLNPMANFYSIMTELTRLKLEQKYNHEIYEPNNDNAEKITRNCV